MWPPNEAEALTDRLRALVANVPDLDLAVLIGSRARGDARADSDIDLVVHVEPKSEEALRAVHDPVVEEFRPLTVDVVTLSMLAREEPARRRAIAEGRVILDRRGAWQAAAAGTARLTDYLGNDTLLETEVQAIEYLRGPGRRAREERQRLREQLERQLEIEKEAARRRG